MQSETVNIPLLKVDFEILQQIAEEKGQDVNQALREIIREKITEPEELNLNADFYEKVTVKVPKAVMDLLRYSQPVTGDTPEQDLEYAIVDSVRARIDSGEFLPTPKDLAEKFNLNPVFKAILDCTVG